MLKRAYQYDLGRQIERPDFLLKWIPRHADWGYNEVCLYLEDAFDFPSVPGVGRAHAYTPRQMEQVVREATRHQIRMIPCVELLGHAQYLLKVPQLRDLSELRDAQGNPLLGGQICPLHEGTLPLARKLLRDVQPYCTSGLVYIGLDETFDIGKCPRCRQEVAAIGMARHFANYTSRLRDLCHDLGLRMGIPGDMLCYLPQAIELLPKDVVVFDWYYYPFKRRPKVELYNFAEVDLTRTLRRAGLDVYGASCDGTFMFESLPPLLHRLETSRQWWHYARARQALGLLITSWCPNYASPELNTVGAAAAASLWLNPGVEDPREMLVRGCQRVFDRDARAATAALIASQKYTEGGYYGWQTRTNWRALANEDSLVPSRQKERHYFRLATRAVQQQLPTPLRETLVLRHYVTRKDLFLQEGGQLLFRARKLVAAGRQPAAQQCLQKLLRLTAEMQPAIREAIRSTRIVWKRSRPLREANRNEQIANEDWQKLTALRGFLREAMKDLRRVWEPNPLLGRWQLLFWVRNFAPALQGAAVEVRAENGEWKTVHSLYSIEFTAAAANPRADFRRHHSVALEWDGKAPLPLRLAVRGLGKLELYGLRLTNGAVTLVPAKIIVGRGPVQAPQRLTRADRPGAILGVPAPRTGFPSIDWTTDQTWVDLEFAGLFEWEAAK